MIQDRTDAFIKAGGWSASKFYPIFADFKSELKKLKIELIVGRSVAYLKYQNTIVKLYVHYQGRSKNILCLVEEGDIIFEFHHGMQISILIDFIKVKFNIL